MVIKDRQNLLKKKKKKQGKGRRIANLYDPKGKIVRWQFAEYAPMRRVCAASQLMLVTNANDAKKTVSAILKDPWHVRSSQLLPRPSIFLPL